MTLWALSASAQVVTRGHSHNDYWQPHPLLGALTNGLCSVEADIFLVGGQLLVAHSLDEVHPKRTLANLYLEPLHRRVLANAGHVYPQFATNAALARPLAANAPPAEFILLIDLKTEGESAYRVLRQQLADYREMLTLFTATSTIPGAVTVILTGNRPGSSLTNETGRLCALDGTISELRSNPSVHWVPLVSENWRSSFGKSPPDQLTADEREKLRSLVSLAHDQGRRIRFWGAADTPAAWAALVAADVDLINTDHPSGLRHFFQTSVELP